MSLVLSDNHYYCLLQDKYSNTFSNMKPAQQRIFRDVVGIAMRAGYEQARLDRIKELEERRTPKFHWDNDENEYVGKYY